MFLTQSTQSTRRISQRLILELCVNFVISVFSVVKIDHQTLSN